MTNIDTIIYGQPVKSEADEMMIEVAKRTLEVAIEEAKYKAASEALNAACWKWRKNNGIKDRVEYESDQWVDMMKVVSNEATTKHHLKRQVSNAKRRLKTAVNRMARSNINLSDHLLPSFHHDNMETYQAHAEDWQAEHRKVWGLRGALEDPLSSGGNQDPAGLNDDEIIPF